MDKHNGTANCPRGVAISFAFVGTHTDSYKKRVSKLLINAQVLFSRSLQARIKPS